MTELARELRLEKVAQCVGALGDLKSYQQVGTLDYLRAHPDTYYAICYRFIAAIEALFDVGQFVLAERGLRADSHREIPPLLARQKLLTDDVANKFVRMYGFRNRLVHAYGSLDDAKVVEYLHDHLVDIEQILTTIKE